MCEELDSCLSRRGFIGAATASGMAAISKSAVAATPLPALALEDAELIQSEVEFPSGPDMIKGYLARPKKDGRYPVVLALLGPPGLPPMIRNVAGMLAEAGFVGLAVTSTSREPDPAVITRDFICSDWNMQRYINDAKAGIAYLRTQPFAKPGKPCVIGFCGGGIAAVTFAARSTEIGGVVAFYADPEKVEDCNQPKDTRQAPIDFIGNLKVPVQFHFGGHDDLISTDAIDHLRQELAAHHNPAEVFVYPGVRHAFYDHVRPDFYAPDAVRLSWKRAVQFLRSHTS